MRNLDSVRFDLSDCTLVEESVEHRMWSNTRSVYHQLRVSPRPPAWPFDLRDPVAASDFYAKQCAQNGGVMLAMDTTRVGDWDALRGMFKYRSPIPNSLGMMFVHILWIPFQDWTVQINVESVEQGTTGAREAAVMMIEGDKWPRAATPSEPIAVANLSDMFDHMAARPLSALPSDDEKYDATFVEHPLSKVRSRMRDVMSSLAISVPAAELAPFRLAV